MAKKEKDPNAGSALNQNIDVGAIVEKLKSGRGPKMPSKTTMNLAVKEKSANSKSTDIAILVVCIIGLLVFAKFGVWDMIQAKNAAQAEVDQAQQELDSNKSLLERYAALSEKYSHYYFAFLNDEELKVVNRVELMDMLGEELFTTAAMQKVDIKGNLVTITFNDVTLEEIGTLADNLSKNEMVVNVDVNTTATYDEGQGGSIDNPNTIITTGRDKVVNATVIIEVENGWLGDVSEEESQVEGAES